MKIISNALVGAVAAGAMAMVPTSAALAQYRDYDRDRGISPGDIIAGAVVLGGIAAVAGSLGRGGYDNRYDDRYYRDGRYGYYNGNPRAAVEQCVNAARRDARSRGYRFAEVTQVRDVNDTRYGWKIRGNLRVEGNRAYYDRGGYYDRGYNDRRYDSRYENYARYGDRSGYNRDSGSFTCWIDRGRVSRMDYRGIRGM
jgi:hypothetical protein